MPGERATFKAKLVYIGLIGFFNFELIENHCKVTDEAPIKTHEELTSIGEESPVFGLFLVQTLQAVVLVGLLAGNVAFELYKTPLFLAASALAMGLMLVLGWALGYYLLSTFGAKVKKCVQSIDKSLQLHDWQAELHVEKSVMFGYVDYTVTIKPWDSSSTKQLLMLEIPISPENLVVDSPGTKAHRGVEAIQFSNSFGGNRSPAGIRATPTKTPRALNSALRGEGGETRSPRIARAK